MNFNTARNKMIRMIGQDLATSEFNLGGELDDTINIAYRNICVMLNRKRVKNRLPLLNFQSYAIPNIIYTDSYGLGYTTASGIDTAYVSMSTNSSGSGLTVDITASGGAVSAVAIANGGLDYHVNDCVYVDQGTQTSECRLVVEAVDSVGKVTSVSIVTILPTLTTGNYADHLISARYFNDTIVRGYNLTEKAKSDIDDLNLAGNTYFFRYRPSSIAWERSEGRIYLSPVPMGLYPGSTIEFDWSVTPDKLTTDDQEFDLIPEALQYIIPAKAAYDLLQQTKPMDSKQEASLNDTCKRLATGSIIPYMDRLQDIYFTPEAEVFINNLAARWR